MISSQRSCLSYNSSAATKYTYGSVGSSEIAFSNSSSAKSKCWRREAMLGMRETNLTPTPLYLQGDEASYEYLSHKDHLLSTIHSPHHQYVLVISLHLQRIRVDHYASPLLIDTHLSLISSNHPYQSVHPGWLRPHRDHYTQYSSIPHLILSYPLESPIEPNHR